MHGVDWVVVPSRWWEASPLVIPEAFLARRPVICSGVGAMAEKVADRVNGLHFPVSDARALANTIRTAVTTPGLWEQLRLGIPAVHGMSAHVENLSSIYRECLERSGRAQAPALT
jgi:glycosyltransferase involved in cell wall biosynthesis